MITTHVARGRLSAKDLTAAIAEIAKNTRRFPSALSAVNAFLALFAFPVLLFTI
jgi:uncharacterized membrane protein YjjP (DUF1212 family)